MALPSNINDREHQKFVDIAPGETAVRVSGENFSGSFSVTGLKVGGVHTVVSINSSSWTALPATALANRNAIAIQNESDTLVKINFSNSVSGFEGMAILPNGGERQYDIQDNIFIYGKCQSGTVSLNVEEIA